MPTSSTTRPKPPAIYLAGDSTVADHGALGPDPARSYCGWGQALGGLFDPGAAVHNLARGGYSTLSFIHDGLWDDLLGRLAPGDTVIVQFGHNDQKLRALAPQGGYAANLRRMVSEARGRGALPAVATPVSRNVWVEGKLFDMLGDYAVAAAGAARGEGVPVFDLHGMSMEFISRLGEAEAAAYFVPGDRTHFNAYGAAAVARMAAACMKAAGMPAADCLRPDRQPPAPPESAGPPMIRTGPMPCEFTDIRGRREEAAVRKLAGAGVIDGCTRHFFPECAVSRAEFAEFLQKACGWDAPRSFEPPYPDVDALSWHTAAIGAAKRAGAVDPGMLRDGLFQPHSDICVRDAVFMAERAAREAAPGGLRRGDCAALTRAGAALILDWLRSLKG